MNTVCIIQARMGSSRLPGKSLLKLGSTTLVEHVIQRAKQAKHLDKVVIATSDRCSDNELAECCISAGIEVFRGSENDLIRRYYDAASYYNASIVVRIPADNPLILPDEVDRCVSYFRGNSCDYASNLGPYLGSQYPDGFGAEVFSFKLLDYLNANVKSLFHREHVTSFMRDESHEFQCSAPKCPIAFARPDVVLDVNTRDEYLFMNDLVTHIEQDQCQYNPVHIIRLYDQHFKRSGYARKQSSCVFQW